MFRGLPQQKITSYESPSLHSRSKRPRFLFLERYGPFSCNMSYIGARSTSILGLIVSTRSCLSKIVPEFVTLGSGSNQASGSNTAAKNQPNLFQGPNAIFSGKFDFSLVQRNETRKKIFTKIAGDCNYKFMWSISSLAVKNVAGTYTSQRRSTG